MSKVLVAYFSASGVTKKVAEEIAKAEQADLFEILPEAPYTVEDLDWTNKQSRSTLEMQDLSCRPPVSGQVENMAQYDVVFIGFIRKTGLKFWTSLATNLRSRPPAAMRKSTPSAPDALGSRSRSFPRSRCWVKTPARCSNTFPPTPPLPVSA